MSFSAFQGSAYQRNAYQIQSAPKGIQYLGGGGDYWDRIKKHRHEEEENRKKLEAERLRLDEINRLLEAKRLQDAIDEAEEKRLQDQYSALLLAILELERLNNWIALEILRLQQEDDDATILLLSLPFVT